MIPDRAKRVCVVTGSRADFGLLRWLILDLFADARFDLRVIATGMHLSTQFGMTITEVERHVAVDTRIECLLSGDGGVAAAKAVGLATISFAEAYDRLQPDIVVLLGDRFEILAATQAALLTRIPVAHIHGGEVTTGAFDDAIRHAITKMSHLHFVAAAAYRKRVLQLGEDPRFVHDVGAPGLDHLARTPLLDRSGLASALGVPLDPPVLSVTYHPATVDQDPTHGLEQLLAALDRIQVGTIIVTMPNADPGGRRLAERLTTFVDDHDNAHAFTSLGSQRYLSLLQHADAVVGNTSSGIIEAPVFGTPTVNIRPRQDGRLRAPSIIDVPPDREAILAAINTAIGTSGERAAVDLASLPYGAGGASARIMEILAHTDLSRLYHKHFVDLDRSG